MADASALRWLRSEPANIDDRGCLHAGCSITPCKTARRHGVAALTSPGFTASSLRHYAPGARKPRRGRREAATRRIAKRQGETRIRAAGDQAADA